MKKVLVAAAAVILALVLGAEINAPGAIVLGEDADMTMMNESVGYVWEGEGPSQLLKRVGCDIGWTARSMKESDITLEMLPNLPVGKRVFYPANCADTPPADVAAASREIFAHERVRLRAARMPRTPKPFKGFDDLVMMNADLKEQVAELTRKLAAAEAAGGAPPISVPNDAAAPNAQDRLVAGLRAELKIANDGWDSQGKAFVEKIDELGRAESLSKMLGAIVLGLLVTVAILVAALFRGRNRRLPNNEPTSEKTGDAVVASVSASPPPKGYASLGGFTGSPPQKVANYRGVECVFDKPYIDDTDDEVHCRCVRCGVGNVKEKNIFRHLRTAEQHLDLNEGLPKIASGEGGGTAAAHVGSTAV